jgi:hypothetical protein
MANSASAGFIRFSENLKRVVSLENQIEQEADIRRAEFRASLIGQPVASANNLTSAYALYRSRMPGGSNTH